MNSVSGSLKIQYSSLSELKQVAEKVIAFADEYKIWKFEGDMGAGKTTLIKEICLQLKVEDNVSSPTFSLVNEYLSSSGETIYHFDFYRIRSEEEALDIGVEEYFYSGHFCFLEWPSKIESLLPSKLLSIAISLEADKRIIEMYKIPGI